MNEYWFGKSARCRRETNRTATSVAGTLR
jgi:hypothetical protein